MTKKISKDKIKTWFVTGASSGIGHEMCKQLLEKGYNVIAVARRIPDFTHENALCLSVDVTQPETIHKAVNIGIEKFGKIDVLVNNAGVSAHIFVEEEELEHVKQVMEVNFFGTFNTMQALIPHFRENKNGTIINNSSMNGLMARSGGTAYSSSKYAIEALTKVIRIEGQKFIRAMVLEFGWFAGTELWQGKSLAQKPIHNEYKGIKGFYKSYIKCSNNLPKAIDTIISQVEEEHLPFRFMLGYDCQEKAEAKIAQLKKDLKKSKSKVKKYSKLLIDKHWYANIFAIREEINKNKKKHKVITILGIKLKFKI